MIKKRPLVIDMTWHHVTQWHVSLLITKPSCLLFIIRYYSLYSWYLNKPSNIVTKHCMIYSPSGKFIPFITTTTIYGDTKLCILVFTFLKIFHYLLENEKKVQINIFHRMEFVSTMMCVMVTHFTTVHTCIHASPGSPGSPGYTLSNKTLNSFPSDTCNLIQHYRKH